ncbi:spermatogenesis- and oogenesis-specific basic helix-loop-helix-containing protein 2 isoform X8 [Canis lupus familiaris]|uniref:spermatogenesis- and oogenesis-specific basic helix-loop-helix-containing protein 2 isoform X8 n=1 Tax=Canis lupus familiaris TaxID=9615 RepID=UPI000BAA31DE|nr:spermatogenesis- and oogenesis-specific basic helix-loop-helix-containing protein 2 isoform X8 [Canis lupus familiaris]XP_038290777.1 spermatogenesis- and oogenesis-specific basic helix-loop-helix-containing protein 2 isoform X8 [Canis lupus familiaris]XP_038429205.1 spermatogenesis- and oogenesis-specific basic helix-loop-helix-containing protein 2 isoform X8 [Canis lupus familiaris]|eukprot:XP_022265635.1 spermatogenesis- and oogenesis-specific basic helix-loop-helix-containing protein 2 isoform X8 [Canis lupus familiaris]
MAALISCPERGQVSGQAKIDLLLVGDVTVQYLADIAQKSFSNIAKVTITMRDVEQAAVLLENCPFDVVFLKMTSLPTAEELEAVELIRFGKKKNTHLLFVFITPENFRGCVSGHGADITLSEPLTIEKMSIVVKYWKTYFSNTVKNEYSMKPEEPGLPLQKSCSEQLGYFSTDLFACSEALRNDIGLELKAPVPNSEKSKKISLLHSSKEKLRRLRRYFRAIGGFVRNSKCPSSCPFQAQSWHKETPESDPCLPPSNWKKLKPPPRCFLQSDSHNCFFESSLREDP